MPQTILIRAGDLHIPAELNDTPCALALRDALPFEDNAQTWGKEVYFDTRVTHDLDEGAREEVEVGEIGYWPQGRALCIFFGKTPASGKDGKPRAASPVNIIGEALGDPTVFNEIRDGTRIRIEVM